MSQTTSPLPSTNRGKRILISALEHRAKNEPHSPWMSVPVDDQDLSRGYRDITYKQVNNAANHTAHWLAQNLPKSSEPFQAFAYAGPKDLRYQLLALAAAKLQKVLVLPSPLVTAEAQLRILAKKRCTIYLRPASMADHVTAILHGTSHIQAIEVPGIEECFREEEAETITYSKTWDEGKDDPWLVYHTSGTTGSPKPVTYTHYMMAGVDIAASLPGEEESILHQMASSRWFTPLPSMHYVGMLLSIGMTTYLNMTAVIGPSGPPTPDIIRDTIRYGRAEAALLPPALIDACCLSPTALEAIRGLKHLLYSGATLSAKSAELLIPYTKVVSAVGTTEAGGYWTTVPKERDAWEYLGFPRHLGVTFERRMDDLHELIWVRDDALPFQQIFKVYPELERFETKDLWREHPVHKGLWKIIGRLDDYVYLSHADGLHASSLEPEITAHPSVKSAVIGGHGRPAPVLLVELNPGTEYRDDHQALIESLQPYIQRVNARVHECVRLSPERVIVATKEKPFVLTVKDSVARLQTLALYEDEIAALFT
ncbi:hypothetical protein ASPCAL02925 [Aspergillus calidoustus]|uniref:AMP-dependent synthetase/ligase domain-containing protein n=1 Tax=Aspergillus calidoustus TaxID=454130 RepID=A0A0U5GP10_ASPCI|nr:hypothetical protein ASPCAL02925 [Aspergillus calidoustus]